MNTFAVLQILLLGLALLAGLIIVPLGLPGLWIMLGAGLLYWILLPAGGIGLFTFGVAAVVVVLAEVLEFTIAGNYTRKYGGSRRAAWGAIIGGIAGAVIGVPVPMLGSLVGAFAGTFAGAFAGEWSTQSTRSDMQPRMIARHDDMARDGSTSGTSTQGSATRAATGALLGRAVASAVKSGLGVLVAIWFMLAAILGAT